MPQTYTAHLHTDWPDSIIYYKKIFGRGVGWEGEGIFQTIIYKKLMVYWQLLSCHNSTTHDTTTRKINVAWGLGGCSQTNCQIRGNTCHKGQKGQADQTEVVEGVVPKGVSR